MKFSQLVGRTIKETPREAELVSHKLLLRAGYIRQFSAGVYGLLPLAQRSMLKIEKIIREEMNKVSGQEVKMPCLMTKELWDESGRYSAIGKDMFRLKDRNDKGMVLGMTHEEPVVAFARTELTSYRQLPAMLYQIQTKFRDEPRPRGGLIRLREFIMKDAYSFHSSEECLAAYYKQVHEAYERIFKRAGCKNFVSVESDNGMFGGKYSHEFIMTVPSGEDTILTCSACDYKANVEVAQAPVPSAPVSSGPIPPMECVSTPGQKSIESLCSFFKISPKETCKAVLFSTKDEHPKLIAVFVRGDRDVSETKLRGLIQRDVVAASPDLVLASGAVPGSTGPVGLDYDKVSVVFDHSVTSGGAFYTGALKDDFHLKNYVFSRDTSPAEAQRAIRGDVSVVKQGDPCPTCGAPLCETRGVEIGNIFNLGKRYSASMGAVYQDASGQTQNHIMGCYGIGVTRLLPSIIEESHDKFGMILPVTIAPFEVHICALSSFDPHVAKVTQDVYDELRSHGVDVLLDDRDEKPGTQFADADLLGIPIRIVISPKTLQNSCVEFKYRDQREPARTIPVVQAVQDIVAMVKAEYARYLR